METTNYKVPEANLPKLRTRLDKIVKKASKLGLPEISYVVGDYVDTCINAKEVAAANPNYPVKAVWVRFYDVAVTGETPRLGGWAFAATLQHAGEAGNILRAVPGVQLPVGFRTVEPACDHCQTQRRRVDTFVVCSEAEGYKQVGRNCLQDFVGGKDPQAAAAMAEYLTQAAEACGDAEEGYGSGGGSPRYGIEAFLAQAAACIRVDGFMSRTKAREAFEPVESTADAVASIFNPPVVFGEVPAKFKAWAKTVAVTAADVKTGEEALAWVLAKVGAEGNNDYFHNLTVVCSQLTVDSRGTGLAASAVSVYLREIGRQAAAKATTPSTHIGTVGERLELDVTVTRIHSRDSNYGTTHITGLVTKEGNALTWFCSGAPLEVGKSYHVSATVKKHDDFRGIKQTVVARVTTWTDEAIEAVRLKAEKKAAKAAKKASKEVQA